MSMMNVRRSTQTFSKAGPSAVETAKTEGTRSAGANDLKQAYGDQSVGDIANKIADPNWVDPNKKVRAVGNPTLDKDAFMKLMLAQMKHQDPTKPMESHEMAAQLAQFTSLEQLNNIHSTLESMKNAQSPQSNYQALALIGKKVSGDASKLTRAAGDTKHGINFELLGDTAKIKVTIKDAAGNVVRKIDAANLKKGPNNIEWNGLNEEGAPARPGEYKISVEGVNSAGKKVYAKTAFEGRITGLNYTPEGPVLLVGNSSVKLSDVRKIEEVAAEETPGRMPSPIDMQLGARAPAGAQGGMSAGASALAAAGAQGAIPAAVAPQAPAAKFFPLNPTAPVMPEAATQTAPTAPKAEEPLPPAEEPPETPSNLASIPMSNQLMAQIAKEVK